MARGTFLQVIQEVCDGIGGGFGPAYFVRRPEDEEKLPADTVIHLGEFPIPEHWTTCSRVPGLVADRFEIVIRRTVLTTVESLANSVMVSFNEANLLIDGVDVEPLLLRELYQAGETGMRSEDGKPVYEARIAYVAEYVPTR